MDTQCIVSFCSEFLTGSSVMQAMALSGCRGALPDKCIGKTQSEFCGNGVRDQGEPCDGNDFGGNTCASFGLPGMGSLRCTASCGLDTSGCAVGVCGNGVIEQAEACDGAALGGATCKDLGFVGGTLACSGCAYDTRACVRCGNGRVETGEVCEGNDLMGISCLDLGYSGGRLACSACQYDTSACARCGNGVIEAGERCDGAMLAGQSCSTLGLGDGMLACDPNVCLFDARGCSGGGSPVCGNGVAERGEACDLKDLAGLDCAQLGFGGGELRCNQQTCRFDTSACTRMTPPTDCSACGREHCAASIDACTSQPQCHGGLDCLANMCGPEAELSCATSCFGNTQPALAALSAFACLVNQCGAQCVGDF
jgi:hypothetical protein